MSPTLVAETEEEYVEEEEEFDPEIALDYRNVVLRDPEGNEFSLGGGEMP